VSIPDVLRVVCVALALPLSFVSFYSALRCGDRWQLLRFAGSALIGVVVTGAQIDGWGTPGTWRMPVVAVALACLLAGSIAYLGQVHRRREVE